MGSDELAKSGTFILITMVLGMFLDGMDGTIVNIALPDISAEFGVDPGLSSWVITIYFLTMSGLILMFGKLSDCGAIKRVLIGGFLIFSIASLACGLSQSMWMLLAFRAIQGIGASMLAASCILLVVKFLPSNRTAFGLSVGLVGYFIGAALGPVFGGFLTQMLSWHWVFFINIPIGLIAAFIAHRVLPKDEGFDRSSFDYLGSALLFVALVAGLYVLEALPSDGLTTVTAASVIVFVVFLAVFIVKERRTRFPVINFRLFHNWRFCAVTLVYIIMNICYTGSLYILPFFMRVEMGFDSVTSGMFLMVTALFTLMTCMWAGKHADKKGNRPMVVASVVINTIAMLLYCLYDAESPLWLIIAGYAALGLVWGVGGGSAGSRIVDNVPKNHRGDGSALLSFYVYLGSALGSALFAGVFTLGSGASGQSFADLAPDVFMDGYLITMVVGLAVSALALILSWVVNERRAYGENGHPADFED